ncbi:phage protein [Streptococcus dysgalactiae subsp. equisimilis 167]|nr:phage protein [Streptococcus dysgalactiae subsp. equisimilis 167]
MTTEEYFKKLLEDSEKQPTNWLSDRVLDKNIKMLDEDIEAEWDDFPLFTKKYLSILHNVTITKLMPLLNFWNQYQ